LEKEKNILQKEKEIINSFEEIVIRYKTTKDESELDNIKKYTEYFKELIVIVDTQKNRIEKFGENFKRQNTLLLNLMNITKSLSKENYEKNFDKVTEYCEKFKKECDLLKESL
ncbi:MAG: hypothetical protein QXL18_04290, partial [Candidatus Woesearchaeota archaeon]